MIGDILGGIVEAIKFIKAQLDAGNIDEDHARAMLMKVGFQITETDSDVELAEYVRAFNGD